MGIDLPDLGEILAGGDELREALRSFYRSVRDKRDEYKAKIKEIAVEELIAEWWPRCPAWLLPVIKVIAGAIVDYLFDQIEGD